MAEIIWTENAVDDLNFIAEFIARDSEFYAKDFVSRIIDRIELLERFPLMGRIVPELQNENIREIIYQNYRLVYKIDGSSVFITIISHGSYDLANRFDIME